MYIVNNIRRLRYGRQYKLLAIDLDGTLLNNKKEISGENLKALNDLHKEGTQISLCTGRHYFSAKDFEKKLGFPCWVISNNGAVVRNPKGGVVSTTYIKKDALVEIVDLLDKEEVYYHMSDAHYNYIRGYFERIDKIRKYMIKTRQPKLKTFFYPTYEVLFSRHYKKIIPDYFVENDGKIASIFVLCNNQEKIEGIKKRLRGIDSINISSSAKNNIEILDKDATKGHSLEKIASHLKISSEDIVAVGDNCNDVTMIQYAGFGVSMENGEQILKDNADWITKTNEENGVAHLIYEKLIKVQ